MVRGLYTTSTSQQRLLSIDEIATACCISSQKVNSWLATNQLKAAQTGGKLIEATEIVAFLAKNGMPVSPALLPPMTRKILFIASDKDAIQAKEATIEHICLQFSTLGTVLAEISSAGRQADLTILTFAPNVVVIFLTTYNKSSANTFNLLASIPELKTILFVDQATKGAMDQGQLFLPAHLVVSDTLPLDHLDRELSVLLTH